MSREVEAKDRIEEIRGYLKEDEQKRLAEEIWPTDTIRFLLSEIDRLRAVLVRLSQWDMLNSYIDPEGNRRWPTADAAYWQQEIRNVLGNTTDPVREGK